MNRLFEKHRSDPPLYKNQPPTAGAISWEKSLFLRIKHTVIRFQSLDEMTQSEQGKLVRPNYLKKICTSVTRNTCTVSPYVSQMCIN